MTQLEIDTIHAFRIEDKQPLEPSYLLQSPTSTFSTVDSSSSRRSSYQDEFILRKHQSLPMRHELLYPTIKSAYDRIDYLEEKLNHQSHTNQSIVQHMNQSIEEFLSQRTLISPIASPCHLELLHTFTQLLFNKPFEKQKIIEFIESNSGVTDDKTTKKDLKNVLIMTIEKEQNKKARLVEAIHTLQKKTKTQRRDLIRLQKELDQHAQLKAEKSEMEQVVDEMQYEMESMLEDLNTLKQEKEHFQEKAWRLEAVIQDEAQDQAQSLLQGTTEDLKQLELHHLELKKQLKTAQQTFGQQVKALQLEKEELRSRLVKSERAVQLEAQMSRQLQETTELEKVLQRTVAQKDGEMAKLRHDLEKLQKQHQQLQTLNAQRLEHQIQARVEHIESNLKRDYQKRSDVFHVEVTRELRQLAGQIVELESEIEGLERQHQQDTQLLNHIKKQYKSLQNSLVTKEALSEKKEAELKQIILNYDKKLTAAEKEILVLYSKNLELVHALGELDVELS